MNTVIFDPYSDYEYICKVEHLLGGIGCLLFEDGSCQFAEFDESDSMFVYSPRLKTPLLNEFCARHIKEYERLSLEHRLVIQKGIPFKIDYFWE